MSTPSPPAHLCPIICHRWYAIGVGNQQFGSTNAVMLYAEYNAISVIDETMSVDRDLKGRCRRLFKRFPMAAGGIFDHNEKGSKDAPA